MKIHNPNNLDLEKDLTTLRALVRGDLHPALQAVEEHKERRATKPPAVRGGDKKSEKQGGAASASSTKASLPANRPGSQLAAPKKESGSVKVGAEKDEGSPAGKSAGTAIGSPQSYEDLIKKRRELVDILSHCEALEIVNPKILSVPEYPSAELMLFSRRRRDLWRLALLFAIGLSLVGLTGVLNPWVAGIATGTAVFLMLLGVPQVRRFLPLKDNSYQELKRRRKELELEAIRHIKMLEGREGLAWQCQRMKGRNHRLAEKRYERMVVLSRQGILIKGLRNVAAFRFYLQYLREAQKTFREIKAEYTELAATLNREYGDRSPTEV